MIKFIIKYKMDISMTQTLQTNHRFIHIELQIVVIGQISATNLKFAIDVSRM